MRRLRALGSAAAAAAVALSGAGSLGAQVEGGPGSSVALPSAVDGLAWLAGCWRAGEGPRAFEEIWMEPRGGVMVGMGRSGRADGTVSWEHLLLSERDGSLTYTALPSGQARTHFAATARGPESVRFENPAHDWPQAIVYERVGSDSVRVALFGAVGDPEPAARFDFRRSPCPS